MEHGEWRGRTVVITGGGRGFGKAFADALCARGAHAVLVDIDEAAGFAAAADIRATGASAEAFRGDVTDPAGMAAAMAQAAHAHNGIDLLINNAGLHSDEYSKPIVELGLDKVRRLFDVNVMGVVTCTLAALPHMQGRAGANIVNISSMAAHLHASSYGDSKLAVGGLTITFAKELGKDGIRVNAISPGMILTDTIKAELPEQVKAFVRQSQALDTDGQEKDIVEAMLYLTSERARFVTGEILRVTGGMGAGI